MLHRITQCEKAAAGILESIAQGNQFLPAINANPPAIPQIAFESFSVDIEIGDIGVAPDKRMERLDIAHGGTVFFASVNLYSPGVTELDRNNPLGRIRTEQQFVIFESHEPATTRRKRGESSVGDHLLIALVLVLETGGSKFSSTITNGRSFPL